MDMFLKFKQISDNEWRLDDVLDNDTRTMPLGFFKGIFIDLLEDKRDSQISKIFNK